MAPAVGAQKLATVLNSVILSAPLPPGFVQNQSFKGLSRNF